MRTFLTIFELQLSELLVLSKTSPMETKPYLITYNQEIGLLTIEYSEYLTVDDIIASMKEAKQDFPLSKNLKVISDFRNVKSDMKYVELPKLIRPTLEVIKSHDSILDAILVNKPYTTALSFLFKGLIKKSNVEYEIFTSIEAAEEWLKNAKT